MVRILFFVAMIALTIYAAADWHRTPEDEMPGKLPKAIWLLIILFTATIAAIGPIVWLALRWVSRAEKKQTRAPKAPKRPTAPDDDPEFLFRASNATFSVSAARRNAAGASRASRARTATARRTRHPKTQPRMQ